MKIKITQTWHTDKVRVLAAAARDQGLWDYSLKVVDKARDYCARRYGYLAASIMARSKTQSSSLGSPAAFARLVAPPGYNVPSFKEIVAPNITKKDEEHINIGTAVSYAPYIEYGTSTRPARPFLRPAFYDTKHEANEAMKKALEVKMKKYYVGGGGSFSGGGGSFSGIGSILNKFEPDETRS